MSQDLSHDFPKKPVSLQRALQIQKNKTYHLDGTFWIQIAQLVVYLDILLRIP
jgi:hypothetical protein